MCVCIIVEVFQRETFETFPVWRKKIIYHYVYNLMNVVCLDNNNHDREQTRCLKNVSNYKIIHILIFTPRYHILIGFYELDMQIYIADTFSVFQCRNCSSYEMRGNKEVVILFKNRLFHPKNVNIKRDLTKH